MPVYLDHNAASPPHPGLFEAMLPFLQTSAGNPASSNSFGRMARSFSAHKVRGPRVTGALTVNRMPRAASIAGGARESKRLADTGNAAAIDGAGKVAQVACLEMKHEQQYITVLREAFDDPERLSTKLQQLADGLPAVTRRAAI